MCDVGGPCVLSIVFGECDGRCGSDVVCGGRKVVVLRGWECV